MFKPNIAAARKAELNRELSDAEKEVDLFDLRLRAEGSRYSPVVYADTWDLQRIRRELLKPGTALVEYALGGAQSYAWAVTTEGLTTVVLPGRKDIEKQIEAYRDELSRRVTALTAGPATTRVDLLGKQIYQTLVAPLDKALAGSSALIVVPDGVLAYLPFEALVDGEKRMIERFDISYTPSASTLGALRARQRTPAPKMLVAFADPVYGTGAAVPDVARAFVPSVFRNDVAASNFAPLPLSTSVGTGLE